MPVRVVDFHPSSPSPTDATDTLRRRRQFDRLAAALEPDRTAVVAGDFNTSPWSPDFRDLVAATGLRGAANGYGWNPTWPSWLWPARIPIDHVLVKGAVAVHGFRRGRYIGSDHFPVVADLRLDG
jgi:endonuclease/exonuclease/phosphatase (EEP) superfamily protein YafD